MSDDLVGKHFGGYEILERIGKGGMATVYRSRQVSMNRIVALKILPRHFLQDDAYLQRFEREVKIISQLEHRNIIPVYDYGEEKEQPFIVMRYMPAGSVSDLLGRGPLTIEATQKIIEQIAPALDYAHTKNVLHRDLKPSNILMDDDGGAYITDFGIARIVGTGSQGNTITTQGVIGTPSYMSPEQAQGKDMDGRSDIYALGVMIFEMTTGRRPFENETPYGVAVMQVTAAPPAPRSINPNLSGAMEQVILKSLKKNPSNRYQAAVQLAEALKLAIERPDSIHDTQPHIVSVQTPPPPKTDPPPVHTPYSGVYPVRPKPQSNFWLNAILGGILGCGMLVFIVAAALYFVGNIVLGNNPTGQRAMSPYADDLPSHIVYFAEEDGKFNLFQHDLISDETIRLTDDEAETSYPRVSPDGTKIAFHSNLDGDFDIYVMDSIVRNPTKLTHNDYDDRLPDWSPDGNYIVYGSDVRQDRNHDLYRIPVEGGEPLRIYSNGNRNSNPRYSPDGRYLVFTSGERNDASTWDILRYELEAGDVINLTNNDVRDAWPSFSPDGETVLFVTDVDGSAAIATLNANGIGEPTIIYDDTGYERDMMYSPDGQYILFNAEEGNSSSIYLMRSDGSEVRRLDVEGFSPVWLP